MRIWYEQLYPGKAIVLFPFACLNVDPMFVPSCVLFKNRKCGFCLSRSNIRKVLLLLFRTTSFENCQSTQARRRKEWARKSGLPHFFKHNDKIHERKTS